MENQGTQNKAIVPLGTKTAKEFNRLYDKLNKVGKKPKKGDIPKLRQLVAQHPEILPVGWTLHETVRSEMIEAATADGANKALMLGEVDRWLKELGYESAPALERIHMDSILTCRLRLVLLETRHNAAMKSDSTSFIEHNDRMLNSTSHRLNKAVESLARIRLLATRAPVFQVNVATNGGQQVNLA
ncbi:MAG: hypothetical protein K8R38_01320 [Verrucomicrobia bacterium]|nr:hypothetical protein [Verrucomicrobiota bacterium]